jgi:protein gp37
MSMNRQIAPGGIEWTRVHGREGYTWNVIGGCIHDCKWTMPDGNTAICYAKEVADRMRDDKFYPKGFEHHYWHPERLTEPLKKKEPAGIFIDSMSDLFAANVPEDEIKAVLDVCKKADWHIFQVLTKHPARLRKFAIPDNVWVGVSAPPTHFRGNRLNEAQQVRFMHAGLDVLADLQNPVRWLSVEPLSFDFARGLKWWMNGTGAGDDFLNHVIDHDRVRRLPFNWMVIGAATYGKKTYQPEAAWVSNLLELADEFGIKVFFKGNLDWPASEWREEFPMVEPLQPSLF